MDPVSLAVGAGLLVVGWVAGRFARLRARPPAAATEPICGCKHHRAQHNAETGECHEWVKYFAATNYVQCTCRQYVGPEPITSYWTPPIAAEESER